MIKYLFQQRVLGALVLVLLAILILPSVFEKPAVMYMEPIPAAPALPKSSANDTKPIAATVSQGISASLVPEPSATAPLPAPSKAEPSASVSVKDNDTEALKPVNPQSAAVKAPILSAPSAPKVDPVSSKATAKNTQTPAHHETTASKPIPKKPLAHSEQLAWTLQVAAFSQQDNAKKLLERLKKDGLHTYQRVFHTQDKRVFYRVYVGPLLDKAQLVKIQAQMEQTLQLKGVIVQYQPTDGD